MIQEPVRVQLALRSNPADAAVVRAALAGIADAADFGPELLADLKTVATEACTNVVLHAYREAGGAMLVRIEARNERVELTVTDHGRGLTEISSDDDRMGLGLAIISALSDGAVFSAPDGGGTEVRMWFDRPTAVAVGGVPADWPRESNEPNERHELTGDVVAWVAPVDLGRFILGRLVRSVAAASRFAMAGVSELCAINDAIAEYAELAADGFVGVALSGSTRQLSMTGGPFVVPRPGAEDGTVVTTGRAEALKLRRARLEEIFDSLSSERFNDHELLHLVLGDTGTGTGDR